MAVLQTVATASNAAVSAGESSYETVYSGFTPEQAESLLSMVEQLVDLNTYVSGFLLFLVLVIILYFIYKFFNIFF